jgi:aminomethyltransferase
MGVWMCCCVCPQVTPNEIYLVVNAGCREKDLAHIGAHLKAAQVGQREAAGGGGGVLELQGQAVTWLQQRIGHSVTRL